MNKPAAFRATYSDLKLIKTRQCVQVIFELPLADFKAAYEILGGLPDLPNETWFAIAPLKLPPAEKEIKQGPSSKIPATPQLAALDKSQPVGAKRDWQELQPAQQAGIRSHDPRFALFLEEEYAEEWREHQESAECIRAICCVHSRSELGTDHRKTVLWNQLDRHFDTWLLKERVGA